MKEFGLSYSQLEDEIGDHPEKYGEIIALINEISHKEAADSGRLKIDDNLTNPDEERIAVSNRMKKSDVAKQYREAAFNKVGI